MRAGLLSSSLVSCSENSSWLHSRHSINNYWMTVWKAQLSVQENKVPERMRERKTRVVYGHLEIWWDLISVAKTVSPQYAFSCVSKTKFLIFSWTVIQNKDDHDYVLTNGILKKMLFGSYWESSSKDSCHVPFSWPLALFCWLECKRES